MCNRYAFYSPHEAVRNVFRVDARLNLQERYNVSPTQAAPIVRLSKDGTGRELAMAHWGLIPFFAKDRKIANKLLWARSETVHKLPSYRAAYAKRRCLILMNGWYERPRHLDTDEKDPWYVYMHDNSLFACASIYEVWKDPESSETIHSFTAITAEPNDFCKERGMGRMPVPIHPDDYDRWLDPNAIDGKTLLTDCPSEMLAAHRVSQKVNNWRNDDPECITPLP